MIQRPKFSFQNEEEQEKSSQKQAQRMKYLAQAHYQNQIELQDNEEMKKQSQGEVIKEGQSRLVYNQPQNHMVTNGRNPPKNTQNSQKQGGKINNNLLDTKQIKPNFFFREDNRSPIPQSQKKIEILPQFKPTQYDPYLYLGKSRGKTIDEAAGKKRRRSHKNKIDNESKLSEVNNSSLVELKQNAENHSEQMSTSNKDENLSAALAYPQNGSILPCSFIIEKQLGVNYMYPDFKILSNNHQTIVSAKKEALHLNSFYNIYSGEVKEENKIGCLRGNFGGTEFNIYQLHHNQEVLTATVIYKTEVSCNTYRKMQLYVNNLRDERQSRVGNADINLKQLYEQGNNDIARIFTKEPTWRQSLQSYTLNFNGKSKLSSTKNTILVGANNQRLNVLLFCKEQSNKYYLQISEPLNLFISMGVLLTSFDFKLLCQ